MKKSTLVLFLTSVVLLVLGGVVGCVGLALGNASVDDAIKLLLRTEPATITYVMYGVVAVLAVVHFIVVLVRKRYSHLAITFVLGFLVFSFGALGGYGIWFGEQAIAGKYDISGTYAYLGVAGGVVVALGVVLTVITYLKSMLDKPVAKGVVIEEDTKPVEEPTTYNFDEKEEPTEEVKNEETPVVEEKPVEDEKVEETPAVEEKPVEEPVAAEAAVVASAANEEAKPVEEPVKEDEKAEETKTEEKPVEEPAKEEKPVEEEKTTAKKGEKKVATKKDTAAKKPAAKKTTATKTTEKKVAADKKETTAKKPAAAKKETTSGKSYHLAKRKEDGKWAIKLANGEKAIKLFDTKEEAMAYAKTLSNNQDATLRVHASKGKSKGKIQKQ